MEQKQGVKKKTNSAIIDECAQKFGTFFVASIYPAIIWYAAMNSSKSIVPDPSSSTSSMMLSRSSLVSLESNSLRISFNVSVEMYPFPAINDIIIVVAL